MSRLYKLLLALAVIAIVLPACTSATPTAEVEAPAVEPTEAAEAPAVEPTEEEESPAVEPTEETIVDEQKDRLIIAQSVDPRTLDPHETTAPYLTVVAQICEPLIYWSADEAGNAIIKKHLATDYRWLDDLTLQFELREGISFTNGEPFDAEAVKVSLEQLFVAFNYSQWLEGLLDEVVIVDNYTVNVVLKQKSPLTESALAWGSFIFAPKDFQERGFDEMVQSPVCTGPWVFKEHVRDDHITLVANDDYWDGTPKYREVIFRIIPDDNARVAALEAGEIDIATFVPLSAASRIEENPDLDLRSIASLRQFATHFDTDNPKAVPLQDVNVRKAFNYAIDRAGMCEQLFAGRCTPMDGQFLSSNHLGYNPDLEMYPYDPELAKQLLADAGYADGFEVDYTYTSGRYPQDKQAGEAIASYLRAIGITVEESAVDFAAWAEMFDNDKNSALYTVGFNFGQDGYLSLSSYVPGKRFRTSIMPQGFDDAVLAAGETIDQAERVSLMQDAMAAINEEPFAVYLYSIDDLYGVQKWVEEFEPRPDQTIRMIEWAIIK